MLFDRMYIIQKNKIKLIIANGYEVLHYEDFFRNGYRIDYDDWIDLLKYLGYEVEYKEISDEEVEEL